MYVYSHAMARKKRVNLYLDPVVYAQAQALIRRIPGSNVSGLVDDLLREMVERLTPVVEAAEKGDGQAALMMVHGHALDFLSEVNHDMAELTANMRTLSRPKGDPSTVA